MEGVSSLIERVDEDVDYFVCGDVDDQLGSVICAADSGGGEVGFVCVQASHGLVQCWYGVRNPRCGVHVSFIEGEVSDLE